MNQVATYNIEDIYQLEDSGFTLPDENTFMGWLESSKNESFGRRSRLQQQRSIIDNFIKNDPRIQPVKGVLSDVQPLQDEKSPAPPKAEFIVSETLARIYHQQKKYQMAIETYEKLSLVYPEKSAYFARLIDKIEKETENR